MKTRIWPLHGWVGLGSVGLFWVLNWQLEGLRTHWGFFPLWLGYILFVDALILNRTGSSLLHRNAIRFVGLFLISAPCWWLFELLNERAQYWIYSEKDRFTDLEYFLWASLSFSTVIPAVFETTELISQTRIIKKARAWVKIPASGMVPTVFFISGWGLLISFWVWPEYGAAFLWMSLYLILDPVNLWIGNPSILAHTARGNWKPVWSLWIASLVCGFFWEFWNFYSNPKWFYDVPHLDFWHLFEMPLPGYLGYLPFSLELFAIYHLMASPFFKEKQNYLRI